MRNVYYTILVVACLIGSLTAKASTRAENSSGFTDIKLDLMKGNFLTSDEIANKNQVTFGIAIAEVVSQQGEDSIFWLDLRSQHAAVLGKTDEAT